MRRTPKASPGSNDAGNSRSVWSAVYSTAFHPTVRWQAPIYSTPSRRGKMEPPYVGCYRKPGLCGHGSGIDEAEEDVRGSGINREEGLVSGGGAGQREPEVGVGNVHGVALQRPAEVIGRPGK